MTDPTCSSLATKAELQELRDQLNSWLGEKESGGTQQIFVAGAGGIVTAGLVADTALQATKSRAKNALTDIALESAEEVPIWKELQERRAKWIGTRGNGAKESLKGLTNVSKVIGATGDAATAATAVAAKNMAALSILANLAAIAASIGINIATVKVFDARIEAEAKGTNAAIDASNRSMLRLYDKNQGDIRAVQSELGNHKNAIDTANSNISALKQDADIAKTQISDLKTKLSSTNDEVLTVKSELQDTKQTIEQMDAEYSQAIGELGTTISNTEASLDRALETIADYAVQLDKAEERILILEDTVDLLSQQYSQLASEFTQLQEDFDTLQSDLEEDGELRDAKSKQLEARLAVLENRESERKAGGSSGVAARGAAQGLTGLLGLMAKLANSPDLSPTISPDEFLNNSPKFDQTFENLLKDVEAGKVDEKQLEDFRLLLNQDFYRNFNQGLNSHVIPRLDDIKEQTTERKLADATKKGVCESLNDGGCGATPGNPNPTDGLKGMNQAMQNKMDAFLAAMGAADLAQGQTILKIVNETNSVVKDPKHGLKNAFDFAEKAWKATHADKILNAITTAVVLHNAVMLSSNLGTTITETASVVLDAVGIDKSDGEPFDITAIVKTKMAQLMTKMLGTEGYASLTAKIAKANRIYQSTANMLYATQELFDSARSLAEDSAQNTGKIGNALLDSGVVLEDSYEKMVDKYSPQSRAMRKLERFREGLEVIEEGVSNVETIASDVISVKDSYTELKTTKKEWTDANKALTDEKKTTRDATKLESAVSASIEAKGFAKDDTED